MVAALVSTPLAIAYVRSSDKDEAAGPVEKPNTPTPDEKTMSTAQIDPLFQAFACSALRSLH